MSYEYGENIKTIEKITFIPYGNKLVKKNSEIAEELGIIHPVSYENGEAKKNGIVDPRLGVTEHFTQCETCGLRNIECPGHFGHTELVEPIFHMGFLTVVKNILSFVCLSCAKIRIGKNIADVKEMLKYNSSEVRFNKMKKLTENLKHCIHCEEPLPKIKIDKNKQKMTTLLIAESLISDADAGGEENKKKKEIIDAQRAYDILRNISDEDCILMGLNPMVSRPADFIIKTFPISPNAIRPTIRADFAAASAFENPITHLISSIVKNTKRFREQKEKKKEGKQDTLRDFNQLVQHNISTYFDNEASGQYRSELKTGGKPLKGMSERLKGKGGRIRNNLMGKRVNFSARTVITSDPNLDLDELGMPLRIAMNLTIPEVVTPNNITKLSKLVSNGRNVYPGANYVLKKNRSYGRRNLIDLRYQNKTNHKLQYGDVVERHMLDGDVVLFNRQPSLHKLSMMSHRIRVINDLRYNTFRMNVNVTPPYNADFDGDEMNVFVPQSLITAIELNDIANVTNHIIDPQKTQPIVKFVQGSVVGSYLMTKEQKGLDWKDAMNLVTIQHRDDVYGDLKKNGVVAPNKLYSKLIPDNVSFSGGSVEIKDGQLIKGNLDKGSLAKTLATTWDKVGNVGTRKFMDDVQRTVLNYLYYHGFSIGYGDAFINNKVRKDIKDDSHKLMLKADLLITEIENNPSLMNVEKFESYLAQLLNLVKSRAADTLMNVLDDSNSFYAIVKSGSKGSSTNVAQIMGLLGQEYLMYNRVPKKINNRSLPYFYQNDDSARARGYSHNSYSDGLTPTEFIFHHMTGREGLIDTAVKTADSGYLSRKLMKAMEDIKVHYDGSVRTNNNVVLQLVYGDNCLNQTLQKKQKIVIMKANNKRMKDMFYMDKSQIDKIVTDNKLKKNIVEKHNDELYKYMLTLREQIRNIYRLASLNYIAIEDMFFMPINMERIITDVKNEKNVDNVPLSPLYVIEQIENMLSSDVLSLIPMSKKDLKNKNSIKRDDDEEFKTLFRIGFYTFFAPKRCIFEYKFSKGTFDKVFENILHAYRRVLVQPGEMVGPLAAQSIGKPSTQMSCTRDTQVTIVKKNKLTHKLSCYKGIIGDFIDSLMDKYDKFTKSTGHKDSYETSLELLENEYYIAGVSENEKVSLNKISHTSRHPTNGNLMKIKTRSGRSVTTTYSHSHLVRENHKVVPIVGKDLKLGMRIPVMKNMEQTVGTVEKVTINNKVFKLDESFGWFIGVYICQGFIKEDTIKIYNISDNYIEKINKIISQFGTIKDFSIEHEYGSVYTISFMNIELMEFIKNECGYETKKIPSVTFIGPSMFSKGLLCAYFDLRGNVVNYKTNHYLTADSLDKKLIHDLGLLYSTKGIVVNYGESYNNEIKIYYYTIPAKYFEIYMSEVGSMDYHKKTLMNDLTKFTDDIDDIDIIPGMDDVIEQCYSKLKISNDTCKNKDKTRSKLDNLIKIFEDNDSDNVLGDEIEILKQAVNSDVVWDEIIEIIDIEDPKEYVYDFTVPGNETFLIGSGVIVHNTLDTFHSTGSGSVGMQGIPRIKELFHVTKEIKTPSMILYLNNDIRTDRAKANKIASYVKYTIINDLIDNVKIVFDPEIKEFKDDNATEPLFVNSIKTGGKTNKSLEGFDWLFRFELNKNKLIENEIDMIELKATFVSQWMTKYGGKKVKSADRAIVSSIHNIVILSNYINSDTPVLHVRMSLNTLNMDNMVAIKNLITNLSIKGIKGISEIEDIAEQQYATYNEDSGEIENKKEWVIYTKGINFSDITQIKGIDFARSFCNDIHEVHHEFGIEAARAILIKEITNTFKNAGESVNFNHLSILVDFITQNGDLTSIDSNGIGKLNIAPLAKASFERGVKILLNSAVFGKIDDNSSVSTRIMTGRVIKGGTGFCDLQLDYELLENSEFYEAPSGIVDRSNDLAEDDLMGDIMETKVDDPDIFIPF